MAAKWIVCERQYESSKYNAGSKARIDVESILISEEYKPLIIESRNKPTHNNIEKIFTQFDNYLDWRKAVRQVQNEDIVVIQYPIRSHTMLIGQILRKLKKNKVRIIGIIHDLESLRLAIQSDVSTKSKIRLQIEEVSALKYFDKIIVHNEQMKSILHKKMEIPLEKMIPLEIFDYLYKTKEETNHAHLDGHVLIAGNLDKEKSGYVYQLPEDVQFDLFGANYDESFQQSNVTYRGKVNPDDLPGLLKGSFGLVWDGPSVKTCSGVFGEYLKYNNPHKCSLYLAAGLPVIIWKGAALADYIQKNDLGICVESLDEIHDIITHIDTGHYNTMKKAVAKEGTKIRTGQNTILTLNIIMAND